MYDYRRAMARLSEQPHALFGIRPLQQGDEAAFVHFTAAVRAGERRFLKETFDDPAETFVAFLRNPLARHLVAIEHGGGLVGLAGVFPGAGWSSHVAELRVLVAATHRRRGVGRALARATLLEALTLGCSQAYVEVVAEQEALVTMFQDMGFEPAALLPDFVRDAAGEFHDLMLLTHRADEQPGLSRILGLDEVLT
jgi:GNAT superfamily N-acetyltransferase